ncbi:Nucleotidyltransferase [Ascodesmis nigricans]|uniref:Nucleotidyltransferase n=1 Tax=Ascodesmis nigricans TaxID=341454 RepID=A0A4S2MLL5_9PEZI|nr:Nucleotidyltransferase [Ascodesmis nigricans]
MFRAPPPLNLSTHPLTHLLPTHLSTEAFLTHQSLLRHCNCPITDSAVSASLFITAVSSAQRARIELRKRDIQVVSTVVDDKHNKDANQNHGGKDGDTDNDDGERKKNDDEREITVIKLSWLTDSIAAQSVLAKEPYMILRARARMGVRASTNAPAATLTPTPAPEKEEMERKRKEILRAAEEEGRSKKARWQGGKRRDGGGEEAVEDLVGITKGDGVVGRPGLRRKSTGEFEIEKMLEGREIPEWIRAKNRFSCCRSTPLHPPYPNSLFITHLKTILHSRLLSSSTTSARAYSTAIATLRAYPFPLTPTIIPHLPGCNGKLAALFNTWYTSSANPESRSIPAVDSLLDSPTFHALRLFDSIWGVGPATARKFVFEYKLTSLDELVTKHWNSLSRVQQIGVKFYDELLLPISRTEVEAVATTIRNVAVECCDLDPPGLEMRIVGGYRRGKPSCHDIDLLFSHRRHSSAAVVGGEFLIRLVKRLEDLELITHTLSLSYPGHHIGSLPELDTDAPAVSGDGNFDSLPRGLLIYRDPTTGVHRRVDIILTPPVAAGTALLGWTGGTTFQRDLRTWCKTRGWRFRCDGVWEEGGGRVVGTEGWGGGESWEEVERRVMERVGVGWREPGERCTE